MANFSETLQRISAISERLSETTASVDDILDEQIPHQRSNDKTSDDRKILENNFLLPSTSFSPYWLNRLQQRWPTQTNYQDLFQIAPTQTRTIVRFNREGLEGRVTGYKELTVPANSATAKNSTSLLRKPANRADFVRGAAGFFPFAPGGLEGIEAIANIESQAIQLETAAISEKTSHLERVITFGVEGALLEVAPGLSRGLRQATLAPEDATAKEVEHVLGQEPEPLSMNEESSGAHDEQKELDDDMTTEATGDEEIDALLPVEFPALAPRGELSIRRRHKIGREWAHMVDLNKDISNFRELVPEMAREWPFELDTFQKEAVYHLEQGDSVFVAAHTSAGKTVVAEYAIALAAKHMTKAIYTSPIKALSNQKFRDFRLTFDDVGILTGDVQIRPEANCLIMTTEILRSMLYRGADLIRDVEFVIFDEVHYVNNEERGVVWEEVIIMLPEHVTLILLSATVPNTYEFASWVGRTKRKDIYVISTPKRPVPLEHYLWGTKDMYKIVDAEKRFLEKGWKEADNEMSGRDKPASTIKTDFGPPSRGNQRGGDRGRGGGGRGGPQRGGSQRGGPQRGGTVQQRGRGNIARTGRGTGRTTAAQDRNIWVHLVHFLRKKELLPACVFVFSKKRCEENADALSSLDFCTSAEKSAIHMTIEKSIARLKPEDRELPQIMKLRELLSRGFAVHHGGMLPILKEVVELLFAKALVKVLFATETFAMGLNLPTRTVCFSGFRKYDSQAFRDLRSDEYTQMAGRAGRRGIDTVGTVIIVTPGGDEAPPVPRLRQMMLGDPTKLKSQFRLTYNMILNLLRVEALKIEEMIKRSFSEDAAQALLPEHQKKIQISESDLEKIKRESCSICDVDLAQCHEACMNYNKVNSELYPKLLMNQFARRQFVPKRLVVFKAEGVRKVGMLTREGFFKGGDDLLVSVWQFNGQAKRSPGDVLPYMAEFKQYFGPLPKSFEELSFGTLMVPVSSIDCLATTILNLEQPLQALNDKRVSRAFAKDQILPRMTNWAFNDWDEADWSKIKDISIRNMLDERTKQMNIALATDAVKCPNFMRHFTMQHDEWLLKESIAQLRQLMSDQNLRLLPDYEQRVAVLKELGFVDDNLRVELKGKVACEVHTGDELILTELILENVLAEYEPEEIVALLSAFVFQEKTQSEPKLTSRLEAGKKRIIEISERITDVQIRHQVVDRTDDANEFANSSRFGMVEVVYEWARGMTFRRITDLTDVMEGSIVRVITRLDETCREVKNAARIVGDPTLYQKMAMCQELIKRDVCAVASLYM